MTAVGAYVLLGLIGVTCLFVYYLSAVALASECEDDMKLGTRIRGMIFPVAGLLSVLIIVLTLY